MSHPSVTFHYLTNLTSPIFYIPITYSVCFWNFTEPPDQYYDSSLYPNNDSDQPLVFKQKNPTNDTKKESNEPNESKLIWLD